MVRAVLSPGPACEVCGSPLPSAESSQATWTPAAIKYMEGESTTHTFQVVDRPSEIAQPTPIPLVTPIVAQPDSGNAAALVEQAETLLKETKSLLLETASLLKERTDTTKTAEPDGNGASDHAVEDLMDAAAQLEERTEALRAEPELQDQPVEELPAEPIRRAGAGRLRGGTGRTRARRRRGGGDARRARDRGTAGRGRASRRSPSTSDGPNRTSSQPSTCRSTNGSMSSISSTTLRSPRSPRSRRPPGASDGEAASATSERSSKQRSPPNPARRRRIHASLHRDGRARACRRGARGSRTRGSLRRTRAHRAPRQPSSSPRSSSLSPRSSNPDHRARGRRDRRARGRRNRGSGHRA